MTLDRLPQEGSISKAVLLVAPQVGVSPETLPPTPENWQNTITEAGCNVMFATPGGVAPTVDEASLGIMGGTTSKREKTRTYLDSLAGELSGPLNLEEVDLDVYDLVFYPGGHGPWRTWPTTPSPARCCAIAWPRSVRSRWSSTPRPPCWPPPTSRGAPPSAACS